MKIALSISLIIVAAIAVTFLARDENPDRPTRKSTPAQEEIRKSSVVENMAANANEPSVITLTSKAASTIKKIIADQQHSGPLYLRIRVVPGGCTGCMHKLDLDREKAYDDHLCELAGVKVVMFKRQVEMLRGAEVDYGEAEGKQGFKIENPNFKGESAKKWLAMLEMEKDVR